MRPIFVVLIVIVAVVIAYFIFSKPKTVVEDKTTITPVIPLEPAAPICVPFTKAMQDAEKRDKLAKCANKLLIPIVGQVQYYACAKNVEQSLTPVNNC